MHDASGCQCPRADHSLDLPLEFGLDTGCTHRTQPDHMVIRHRHGSFQRLLVQGVQQRGR